MANNRQILANLYTMMEQEIFADRLSKGEFATLMNPGQFISPNLGEENDSDDMAIQAEFANIGLDTSFSYAELPSTVDTTYKEILYSSALPTKTLTTAEETELETIRKWMEVHEADYTLYRDRYYDVLEAYEIEAARPQPDPSRLRRLARLRDDALDTWKRSG